MERAILTRHKIVVLNPKGGSGKTTIATGLASWFACRGLETAIMDYDPLNLSMRWLSKRPEEMPPIHGVSATELHSQMTRAYQLRIPRKTRIVIVDTPAAVSRHDLLEYLRDADVILCPVGPSDLDIHSASIFMNDLLRVASSHYREGRIGVVANRIRKGTVASRNLMLFLDRLDIPVVSVLRDSQNYLHCVEGGVGLSELEGRNVRLDRKGWGELTNWLAVRCGLDGPPLTAIEGRRAAPSADKRDAGDRPPLYVVPQGKA
jgi:chromosome partitioning protein